MQRLEKYPLEPNLIRLLVHIEKFQSKFVYTNTLDKTFITKLKRSTIITSSGSSTRIEGSILTDNQVKVLISQGNKITKFSSRSQREVAGYVNALKYIYKHYNELDVNEKNIRELHKILTDKLTSEQLPHKQRGSYKDITNNVVEKNLDTGVEKIWFRTTPPGPQTDAEMYQLVETFNQMMKKRIVHPIITIAGFIIHFLAIHPFRDGNGRLSRLLTVWLMLKSKYLWIMYASHEKIIEDNKENYYFCLRKSQNTFLKEKTNYSPWMFFFLSMISTHTSIISSLVFSDKITITNKNHPTKKKHKK